MLLFYTPWKQKTFRFSVFRGYRKATPGCNRLIITGLKAWFTSSWLESQERMCQIVWNLLVLKFCKNLMIRDLVATLRKSLVSFCVHQIYWTEVSSRGEYILFCNRIVLKKYVWVILFWSSGPAVKAMDFLDSGPWFKNLWVAPRPNQPLPPSEVDRMGTRNSWELSGKKEIFILLVAV